MSDKNFYFTPQVGLLDKWFGFGVNGYWDNNDVARYFSLCFAIFNISVTLTAGFKTTKN